MPWSRCFAALVILSGGFVFGLVNVTRGDDEAPAAEAPPAEEPELSPVEARNLMEQQIGLEPTTGPALFDVGPMAQIDLPEGYQGFNPDDTRKLLRAYGNPTGDNEMGCVEPVDADWFVVFQFDHAGYVKDDDKDELDADKMLEALKSDDAASNELRRKMKMDELTTVGWEMPPNYDPQTHNLQWAIRLRSSSGAENVNHSTRLLGRRGVMRATLVCGPGELQTTLPDFQKLLSGYSYKQDEDYASFSAGDKVAEYGLAALVTGGAAAVAYKTGLLAKLGLLLAKGGKALLIGGAVVLAFLGRLIGRLLGFGKKFDRKAPRAVERRAPPAMTSAEWLFVTLAALYASECVFTIRRDALVLASTASDRWRRKPIYCPAGGADWGLVIGSLWPSGLTIATGDWPISFGVEGALGYVARCQGRQGRIRQLNRWTRYDAILTAACEGRTVTVDGQPLAEAASERDAETCAKLLGQLRELAPAERPAAIRAALDTTLAVEAIDVRLDELQAASFLGRAAGIVLFLVMFGGAAALLWWSAAFSWWPALLALLVVAHVMTVVGFLRGLRTLGLRHVEGMTKHVVTAFLSPLAAVRGTASMSRHALDGFHPLACAVALLPRPVWSRLAGHWLRDLRHPLPPACEHAEDEAQAAERESRDLVRVALAEFLAKHSWNEAAECAAPEPEDPTCVAYCPRCLAQFTSLEVDCPNCGGLATVAFVEENPVSGEQARVAGDEG